jgi:hypothetical protein
MMMLPRAVLLVITVAMVLSAPVAFACTAAGPDAHIGTVTAVDSEKKTLRLKDAESGMDLTFIAAPELLKTVNVNDQVTVKYKPEGRTLRATSITRG